MRSFVAWCAAAALWSAGRAEASQPPICLEWGVEINDGGYPADHATNAIVTSPSVPSSVEPSTPEGEGTLVEAPPGMRRFCKKWGWRDDYGCAVAGGAPAGLIALAVLGVAMRRARRRPAGTGR